MKREEAIAILDISKTCHGVSGRKYDEAIDMAISALSAESETLTHEEAWEQIDSDLISRADAVEAVMNTEPVVFDSQSLEPHQKTKDVIDALSALPSADRPTCIDCTHWFEDGSYHAGWGLCNVHDSEWDKTGYCSYAERK